MNFYLTACREGISLGLHFTQPRASGINLACAFHASNSPEQRAPAVMCRCGEQSCLVLGDILISVSLFLDNNLTLLSRLVSPNTLSLVWLCDYKMLLCIFFPPWNIYTVFVPWGPSKDYQNSLIILSIQGLVFFFFNISVHHLGFLLFNSIANFKEFFLWKGGIDLEMPADLTKVLWQLSSPLLFL